MENLLPESDKKALQDVFYSSLSKAEKSASQACSIADMVKYIEMRKEQTKHNLQVEKLSGNTVKEQIEMAVLCELTAMQSEIQLRR